MAGSDDIQHSGNAALLAALDAVRAAIADGRPGLAHALVSAVRDEIVARDRPVAPRSELSADLFQPRPVGPTVSATLAPGPWSITPADPPAALPSAPALDSGSGASVPLDAAQRTAPDQGPHFVEDRAEDDSPADARAPRPRRRPRDPRGRQGAPVSRDHDATLAAFEEYLGEFHPELNVKTVRRYKGYMRKMAWVAEQEARSLADVDRAIFQRAARGRFEDGDNTKFRENRASASSANGAKNAVGHFTDFMRRSGYPEWTNPAEGASLPKPAPLSAPRSIPSEANDAYLRSTDTLARRALERYRQGNTTEMGRTRGRPIKPLRLVAGYAGLAVTHFTGLRIHEVVALRIDDITFSPARRVKVFEGKGDQQREVPFGKRLAATLRWYLDEVRPLIEGADGSDLLLLDHDAHSRRGSFPEQTLALVEEWFWTEWSRGTEYEGLPWTPHWGRHSYATTMLEHGEPQPVVQKLLGHRKSETTARYTGAREDQTRRAAERLDAVGETNDDGET